MNAEIVRGRAIRETRHGTERGRKPGRRRRAGVLHQTGSLGMLKGALRLAVVVEAELIDRVVADRPGVGDVPLLETLTRGRRETRNVGAGSLELCERATLDGDHRNSSRR